MEHGYWEQFTRTGLVSDYLSYRGIRSEKNQDTCAIEVGEKKVESADNSDGDDPVRSAYR